MPHLLLPDADALKLLDISMQVSESLPAFPGSPRPAIIPWSGIRREGYNLEMLFMSTHTGTHVDAPYHFAAGGRRMHEIGISRLVRDATLVECRNRSVSKSEILAHEKAHGEILPDATILFRTDWSKNPARHDYFTGNPGLEPDAARYLAKKRPNMIGIDSPSVDSGSASKFPVHKILAKNDILIVENLCRLDKIRRPDLQVMIMPLLLLGASGAPARAAAVLR